MTFKLEWFYFFDPNIDFPELKALDEVHFTL